MKTKSKIFKPVKSILIKIEWVNSKLWGKNPRCEAEVLYKDNTFEKSKIFRCSGYGYDKESTVISDVFNTYLSYKLHQIERFEDIPYGIKCKENIKYYQSAIGVNCYYAIAEFIGGKFEHIASGKNFDVYKYSE